MTAAHFFPTAEEFRSILAPVVSDAIEQLGSIADLFPVGETEQADGSTIVGVSGPAVEDVPIKLTELTNEQAQEVFGRDAVVTMQGKVMRDQEVLLDYVFEVTGGDFAGRVLQVKSIIENPLSDSYLLGLIDFSGDLS